MQWFVGSTSSFSCHAACFELTFDQSCHSAEHAVHKRIQPLLRKSGYRSLTTRRSTNRHGFLFALACCRRGPLKFTGDRQETSGLSQTQLPHGVNLEQQVNKTSMAAEGDNDLDPSVLQALSEPQSAERVYCALQREKRELEEQLSQLQAAQYAEHTSVPSSSGSQQDRWCEMLGQLHQLATAAMQETSNMLKSCSNNTSGNIMLSTDSGTNFDPSQDMTGRNRASVQLQLLSSVPRPGESGLLGWGSGISESDPQSSDSHSADTLQGAADGSSEPFHIAVVQSCALGADHHQQPPEGLRHSVQPHTVESGTSSSPPHDLVRTGTWGSGAGMSMSGRSSLHSTLDGVHEPAALRLPSRLAVSSGVNQQQNGSLQAWGSGVSPRWNVQMCLGQQRESTTLHRPDCYADLAEQLQAALGQVDHLQHQRQLLETLCHQSRQQEVQLHASLEQQEHKLLTMKNIIEQLQSDIWSASLSR